MRLRSTAILRIYELCTWLARGYIGQVEGANIIKLNRHKPKVSYLSYPKFDKDPHPALAGSLVIDLRTFDVQDYDYSNSENPPILHRKEEFISADYPNRTKFESLTHQEERCGLYENTHSIGTREGWDNMLKVKGVRLHGHKLIRV
jgi:DNA phosphorothioation-associated putative methyltransferase